VDQQASFVKVWSDLHALMHINDTSVTTAELTLAVEALLKSFDPETEY
jgi:hypothetical protein